MNVLMLSPGFPDEMRLFTRGLAEVGVDVIGLGDQPEGELPPATRRAMAHYVRVPSLWDEEAMIEQVRAIDRRIPLDRIECLWEPAMMLAARLREALRLPGMDRAATRPFRDKEIMKRRLDEVGIRTPRHGSATGADEVRAAVERIGFPVVIKPIAGAGSADTHRVDGPDDLERVLPLVRHVAEMSVEEFIDGEEFTFDTICADGRVLFYNVSWYRPRPLVGRTVEWVSPQTVGLRDPGRDDLAGGVRMGFEVLKALDFHTGFTHMEWYRQPDGTAIFGEIAARPPGAHSVDLMNFCCDIDTFTGWAEAACHGRLTQPVERRYNSAIVFKRAIGDGRVRRIEGLARLVARYRPHIVCIDLLPVGASRRNWRRTLLSDGFVTVRHPDLDATLEMADRIGTDLRLYAG